jgi:uncharacterized protein
MFPREYLTYLVHFHSDRDYFECHEILEEYWKSLPTESRSPVWVGLIQIAVSLYHLRRGNFVGAEKMLSSAIRLIRQLPQEYTTLALDVPLLLELLEAKRVEIEARQPYTSLDLPITSLSLLEECRALALQKGLVYGQPSDLTNHYLCNKHTLRDRSDVIAERERSLQQRQLNRQPPGDCNC